MHISVGQMSLGILLAENEFSYCTWLNPVTKNLDQIRVTEVNLQEYSAIQEQIAKWLKIVTDQPFGFRLSVLMKLKWAFHP